MLAQAFHDMSVVLVVLAMKLVCSLQPNLVQKLPAARKASV